MKKNFNQIYSEINQNCDKLYMEYLSERKESKRIIISVIVMDIIITALISKAIVENSTKGTFVNFLMIVLSACLFYIIPYNILHKNRKGLYKYSLIYKENVIKKIIENFYNDVLYNPKVAISRELYDEPKCFERYEEFYSDDFISAKTDSNKLVNMAEIKTIDYVETKDRDGHKIKEKVVRFHGLFARMMLDKEIMETIRIYSHNKSKRVGIHAGLGLDSGEFEDNFNVFTTNEIVALEILTADVMEEILKYRKKDDFLFDIIIKGKYMYLRFHSGNTFEPKKLEVGPIEKTTANQYFNILEYSVELFEKINNVINNILI